MNAFRFRRTALALSAVAVLPLTLTACGSDDSSDKSAKSANSAPAEEKSTPPAAEAAPTDGPFGSACASVPKDGAGSFDGMSKDPVATAASNNPALSTLVTAVKKAGLVDTLNSAENITVFAPTNDAFAKIPKADLDKVLADKQALTDILTYHVVGQKLAPKQLEGGTYPTLQKSNVTTVGAGAEYTVNDSAKVVCGNVPTANATVYIIDTVLMPKK
ncbi:fasciclin domain-containing protein [Streptomyces albipurpureus]|uniref:Fasciclin domain-containing protein n=1 Tax=Streptomyces albipurpureus TaxID=2897419 RepID=A0ABT0UQY6_9ACTN|nr:fasciclin domain-containing protein [Streptomyces sp. CWNU-1]MCM2390666.1 fasciclin domain-containing protein [Streptomyces sp. CWNU-1]